MAIQNRFLFQVTFHFYFLLLLLFLNTHSPLLFIFSLCRIILPGTSIRNYTFPFFSSSSGSLLSFSFSLFLSPSPQYFFTKLATPWTWLSVMVCTLYSFSNLSFCASSLKWLSFEQNERKVVFIIQFLFTICHFHLFIFQSHSQQVNALRAKIYNFPI